MEVLAVPRKPVCAGTSIQVEQGTSDVAVLGVVDTQHSSNDPVYELSDSSLPEDNINMDMTHGSKILIDTHCHLDFLRTKLNLTTGGLSELRSKYRFPSCFEGCIAVFCDPRSWFADGCLNDMVQKLRKEGDIRFTFGCHPHFADHMLGQDLLDKLEILLNMENIAGIGEIGLDYSRKNQVEHSIQQLVFRAQLDLALKLNKPICLHIREADDDALRILEEACVPLNYRIHLHCFNGNWDLCQRWLNKYSGCKIGITGLVTYAQAEHLHDVVQRVDLSRILLETDAPYFPISQSHNVESSDFPHIQPFSHPGHAIYIALRVAQLRGMDWLTIIKATKENIKQVYDNTEDLSKPLSIPQISALSPTTSSVESIRARPASIADSEI